MKIGILTIHTAHNYGSVLQALAIQETLKSRGYIVEIINYNPTYISEKYTFFRPFTFGKSPIETIKQSIHNYIIGPLIKYKRYWGFKRFMRQYFNHSGKQFKDIKQLKIDYDIYIIGSDQVWNPVITQDDPIFWGNFPHSNKAKIISYAASMESIPLTDNQKVLYKLWLTNFNHILVRESSMLPLLQPLTNTPIRAVLDPTLISPFSLYKSIESKKNFKNKFGRYVFIYCVIEPEELSLLANKVAEKLKLKIVRLNASPNYTFNSNEIRLNNITPPEFLSLIRDSEYVIATSFHGTAFSLIYHKNYYTVPIQEQGSRVETLLNSVGLHNRIVTNLNNLEISDIDYTEVDKKMEILRVQSIEYLKNALE